MIGVEAQIEGREMRNRRRKAVPDRAKTGTSWFGDYTISSTCFSTENCEHGGVTTLRHSSGPCPPKGPSIE